MTNEPTALSVWRATSADRRLLGIVVDVREERAGAWRNTILDDQTTAGDDTGAQGDLYIAYTGILGRYRLGSTGVFIVTPVGEPILRRNGGGVIRLTRFSLQVWGPPDRTLLDDELDAARWQDVDFS